MGIAVAGFLMLIMPSLLHSPVQLAAPLRIMGLGLLFLFWTPTLHENWIRQGKSNRMFVILVSVFLVIWIAAVVAAIVGFAR